MLVLAITEAREIRCVATVKETTRSKIQPSSGSKQVRPVSKINAH